MDSLGMERISEHGFRCSLRHASSRWLKWTVLLRLPAGPADRALEGGLRPGPLPQLPQLELWLGFGSGFWPWCGGGFGWLLGNRVGWLPGLWFCRGGGLGTWPGCGRGLSWGVLPPRFACGGCRGCRGSGGGEGASAGNRLGGLAWMACPRSGYGMVWCALRCREWLVGRSLSLPVFSAGARGQQAVTFACCTPGSGGRGVVAAKSQVSCLPPPCSCRLCCPGPCGPCAVRPCANQAGSHAH